MIKSKPRRDQLLVTCPTVPRGGAESRTERANLYPMGRWCPPAGRRQIFGVLHQHRPSGGQAFRNAKSSQRMIISAGKMVHQAARYPARESGRGLLRAPQKSHKSASGRRSPQETHGRNGTLRYAWCSR